MLSYFYLEAYQNLLKDYTNNLKSSGDKYYDEKKYTLFYPIIGKDYNKDRELLVVGQATSNWNAENNSWNSKASAKDFSNIISKSREWSKAEIDNECPLEWVNSEWEKWKLYRSAFWNLTYNLVKETYNITDENWNNIIAYRNLMKISPSPKGNPNEDEKSFQLKCSAELFKMELEELRPKNCLIITNFKNWAEPIFNEAKIKFKIENGVYVQATADYKNTNIIVTQRPFHNIKPEPFINDVSKYLVHRPSSFLMDNTDFGKMTPDVE